ncbi:MAG: helix-turn-helix transcriptional regulator [Pseudomonadota bacterium]
MRHSDIWQAIDALAAANGLTTSALARAAGLDPTAFNRSKRHGVDGRPRWPSTESVARALIAVDATLSDLAALISGQSGNATVPLIGFAEAGRDGFFDAAGLPTGDGWTNVTVPWASETGTYALEVSGHSMSPVLRPGDRLVVSSKAPIEPGDRIVVRTKGGEVMAKQLENRTDTHLNMISLNERYEPRALPLDQISWLARIQWVSQ